MSQSTQPTPRQDLAALANLPLVCSAAAESLAGALLAGASAFSPIPYLVAFASALLFAAGSLLGHFFDRPADEELHPDRPLPAGRIAGGEVWNLALLLLATGVVLGIVAGILAHDVRTVGAGLTSVLLAIVIHAGLTKSIWGAGFVTVGLARGLNFLFGMTAEPTAVGRYLPAAIPVALFGIGWAVLRASRQPGTPPTTSFVALVHLAAALVFLFYRLVIGYLDGLPFAILLLALLLPRLVTVMVDPRRPPAMEAVQYGFLSFTVLEAALVGASPPGLRAGLLIGAFAVPIYVLLRRWPVGLVLTPR